MRSPRPLDSSRSVDPIGSTRRWKESRLGLMWRITLNSVYGYEKIGQSVARSPYIIALQLLHAPRGFTHQSGPRIALVYTKAKPPGEAT